MYGDEFMLALAMWREARGDGQQAMLAVGCVVRNRVAHNQSSYYAELIKPLQFSSLSYGAEKVYYEKAADGYKPVTVFVADPETVAWPHPNDREDWAAWMEAQALAHQVLNGAIADVTNGATYYYATTIPRPSWAARMTQTAQIGRQIFFKE